MDLESILRQYHDENKVLLNYRQHPVTIDGCNSSTEKSDEIEEEMLLEDDEDEANLD